MCRVYKAAVSRLFLNPPDLLKFVFRASFGWPEIPRDMSPFRADLHSHPSVTLGFARDRPATRDARGSATGSKQKRSEARVGALQTGVDGVCGTRLSARTRRLTAVFVQTVTGVVTGMTSSANTAAALTHAGRVDDLRLAGTLHGLFFIDDAIAVVVVRVAHLELGHTRVDLIDRLGKLVVVHLTGEDTQQA